MRVAAAGALLLLLLGSAESAQADDIRPLYIEIEETGETGETGGKVYDLRVKIPPRLPEFNRPRVRLPDHCVEEGASGTYRCGQDLSGAELKIDYPPNLPPIAGVVKVIFSNGESHTLLMGVGETRVDLPRRETGSQVAADYTGFGIHHIWVGYDHLLFLLCLLWIAGSLRRVLITITGFTLAHSVTLALSALEVVRLPVPPIEAVIALSVLFLATEVAKGRRDSLTWRYPVAVSSSFGLLHGLGFAAVLSEIGLPKTELIMGLVFFNVGVEIGQVLFAVVVVSLLRVIHLVGERLTKDGVFELRLQTTMGYLVGCTAAYWLIARVVPFINL